jgi:hypothetical protein
VRPPVRSTPRLILDHFCLLIGLLGIPAAVLGAILFDVELSRLAYGAANPFRFFFEVVSLLAIPVLILWLRTRLSLPSAPNGFYRHVLDFLALKCWHPAVKLSFATLLLFPLIWFAHGDRWLFIMFRSLGRRALVMSDVRAALDGLAVAYQVTLLGALLFFMHLVCRWKPSNRYLPWLLIPLLVVATVIATIAIVTVIHFSG